MTDRKWKCQAPNGEVLNVEMPCDGCIMWVSSLRSRDFAFAIVHCSVFMDWGGLPGFYGFTWERFPADSNEVGMYYYLALERGQRKILKAVSRLEARGLLLPLQSGPAVLDFPIMCADTLEDSVGLQYYMNNLRHNRFDEIDNQDMFKMYEAGYSQFKLLPTELVTEIPWYEFQISDEYTVHKRLMEQDVTG